MVRNNELSREGFERLVEKTLATLPDEFQSYMENVVIIIEDEPSDGTTELMGLYEGIPLVERSIFHNTMPDYITLYEGPIKRACSTISDLEDEVRLTILHEIGHFFGLEESQLEQLDLKREP